MRFCEFPEPAGKDARADISASSGELNEHVEDVKAYYADAELEWNRLAGAFAHEKYITVRMMERFLPAGGRILDAGGGPGHYAIHFAEKGYDVTLFDLSGENLALAQEKAAGRGMTFRTVQGNATDLSAFPDGAFDAVFLMGPLYHLVEEDSRKQAVREAVRGLKKGGCLFCSFILTYANVIYSLRNGAGTILDPEGRKQLNSVLNHDGLAFVPFAFTYAYETSIRGAKDLISGFEELRIRSVFGQEGILAPYCDALASMPEEERTAWYEYSLQFCEKEEFLSHAEHLMIVAEKA